MTRLSFVASLLATSLAALLALTGTASGQQPPSSPVLEQLQKVQNQIRAVADKNMAACVAVDDGVGMGSGVIISKEGYVLTAGHVMVGQNEYRVLLPDGRTANATPLGRNLNIDAGLIKITDPGPWPFVKIGKSASIDDGGWVVSLGHSGGFELGRRPPVRSGRILSRNNHQLVTDAVLIGGDSGGPLFDLDGKLIAIHSSIGDSVAENRHVKIEIFERDFKRLRRGETWGQLPELSDNGGDPKPPRLGIRIDKRTAEVTQVKVNSAAADVGIQSGDVVLEFDGIKIENGQQLIDTIKTRVTGDVARIKIRRGERIMEMEIRLR